MKCHQHIFLILVLLLMTNATGAQKMDVYLTHYSKSDGLPDHRVTSVIEHSNGFVYFGTWNGLGRFDGTRCVEIPMPNHRCIQSTYPRNYIHELRELTDGRLMILQNHLSPKDCPVLIYNPKNGQFTHGEVDEHTTEDQWIINGVVLQNKPLILRTSEHQLQIAKDHHGNWLTWGVENEEYHAELSLSLGESIDLSAIFKEFQHALPIPFGEDFSKYIFFASSNGLFKIDVQQNMFANYLSENIADWQYGLSARSLFQLPDGRMLFATDFESLYVMDKETDVVSKLKVLNLDSKSQEFIGPVRGMHQISDSTVALVLNDGNVLRYNFVQENFKKIAPISKPNIKPTVKYQASTLLNDTILCLSNYNEPVLFDLKNDRIIPIPQTRAMLREYGRYSSMIKSRADGTLWYGTVSSLFHLDPLHDSILFVYTDTIAPLPPSIPEANIRRILPVPTVHEVCQQNDNVAFLATDGGGLAILDLKNKTCRNWTVKEGLADNTVCTIEAAKGGYWIGTYNGLSYLDTNNFQFTNYYTENGLPHNELNRLSSYSDGNGSFYFGTMNGVFRFNESSMIGIRDSCRLLISSLTNFDRQGKNSTTQDIVFDGDKIFLPASNRSFSIELGMDEFHNPGGHRYFYQLIKAGDQIKEDGWQGLGLQSTLRFEYLDAGNYSLLLKGVSSSGHPSNMFTLHLQVEEFFYKRWWFIALVVLLIVVMVYAVYRNKVNKVLQIAELKNQLSSDLHDDVGSVLSGVAYQMDLLSYSVEEEHKSTVQRVAHSSRKAMAKLRDVVWAVNPNSSGSQDLFERMKEFSSEQLEPLHIQCVYENLLTGQSIQLSTEIRHAFILIFKEFLTNTIKHSGADTVRVVLKKSGSMLVLELKDNGKGLAMEDAKKNGMGLKSMEQRMAKIKGKFELFNDHGLTVRLSAPL